MQDHSTVIHLRPARASQARRRTAAGGIVLSIGSMATLASWNDSEFASATFTAGRFDLEGSLDNGTTYGQHNPSAGALTFTAPVTNLSPGRHRQRRLPCPARGRHHQQRIPAHRDHRDRWWLHRHLGDRVAEHHVQRLQRHLHALDEHGFPRRFDLLRRRLDAHAHQGRDLGVAGAPVYVCFKMIAGSNLPQSQVTNETWTFTATSQ